MQSLQDPYCETLKADLTLLRTSTRSWRSAETRLTAEDIHSMRGKQAAEAGSIGESEALTGVEASVGTLPQQFKGLEVSYCRTCSDVFWAFRASRMRKSNGRSLCSLVQVVAKRSDSLPAAEADAEPVWLLINDFCICQTAKSEALQLFNSHKLPCLLYYTQAGPPPFSPRRSAHMSSRILDRGM